MLYVLHLAIAHGRVFISEGVALLFALGPSQGDGIGNLIKRLVLSLWHEEEDEGDGGCQDDGEDDVGVLT